MVRQLKDYLHDLEHLEDSGLAEFICVIGIHAS
jgi:hypothetical protein